VKVTGSRTPEIGCNFGVDVRGQTVESEPTNEFKSKMQSIAMEGERLSRISEIVFQVGSLHRLSNAGSLHSLIPVRPSSLNQRFGHLDPPCSTTIAMVEGDSVRVEGKQLLPRRHRGVTVSCRFSPVVAKLAPSHLSAIERIHKQNQGRMNEINCIKRVSHDDEHDP
jgi:hypothetical protein